ESDDTQPALVSALVVPAVAAAALRVGRRPHGRPRRLCAWRAPRQHAVRSRLRRWYRPPGDPHHRWRYLPALPDDARPIEHAPAGHRLWTRRGRAGGEPTPAPVPAAVGPGATRGHGADASRAALGQP